MALAEVEVSPLVATLFDAVNRRSTITFDYRDTTRRLEPYGVVLRFGHWYVVGRDLDRDAPRLPRRPHRRHPRHRPRGGVRAADGHRPRRVRADDRSPTATTAARVLVDATRAALVVDSSGEQAVVARRDDGAIEVRWQW